MGPIQRDLRLKGFRGFDRSLLATTFLVALCLPGVIEARELPPSIYVPVLELDEVDQRVLTGLDNAKLLTDAWTKEADKPGVPMKIAEPVQVDFDTANSGTWEDLPDGSHLWRLQIISAGAEHLNLALSSFDLGNGARLWVYDPAKELVQGPFTNRHRSDKGRLFTPLVRGDRIVVELQVPAGCREDTSVQIGAVNHGFRKFDQKQGACNNDIVCPEGDPWRNQIRSVARYTISGFTLCSGQLVNNTAIDGRPLFLSAQHCGINQANEDSLVVYWNYESPTCGDLSGGSLADNQTGSTYLASYFSSDFVLVELSEPPDAFGVFYSGWNVSGATPQGAVAIHHPGGDEKAISFDNDPLTKVDIGYGGNTHWEVGNWEDGTTEPGSSGACIWDPTDGLCVGVLTGGIASCFTIGFDVFGSLDVGWEGAGTSDTRLKDWLDPLDSGVTSLAGFGQSPALAIQGPAGGLIGQHLSYDAVPWGCSPDNQPYTWSIEGLTIDAGPSITVIFDELGDKHLEVSHPSCEESGQKTVVIVSDPLITIEGPATTVVGLLTELTALPIGCPAESDGWSWSAAGISFIGGPTITIRFGAPGLETVSVSHPNCPAVGTTTIEVIPAEIFSDGFESGDTTAWSSTIP